ncbi:PiggyBac transposable element-derived protein 4 [Plakobranchus ocellatus]|uniref:PiggyBac transposable element-derived protein 4 n=1 Tax=Plakobranchus ocellatus TaxID=259542 RepID=A0AAV3Y7G4_9GAST|nr:PiggyBac transposable element-derived protein 4 [Plakobranchus ocellatus]
MPAVGAIDIEIADTEWIDASPDFTPQRHKFSGEGGIHFDDTGFKEIDYISQFLDDEFWRLIATETNRKAVQFFTAEPRLGPRSIFRSWYEMNPQEMRKFIGLILLMGLVKKPRW